MKLSGCRVRGIHNGTDLFLTVLQGSRDSQESRLDTTQRMSWAPSPKAYLKALQTVTKKSKKRGGGGGGRFSLHSSGHVLSGDIKRSKPLEF